MKTTRWWALGATGTALTVVFGCGQVPQSIGSGGTSGASEQAPYQVLQSSDGSGWSGDDGRGHGGGGGNEQSSGPQGPFVPAAGAFSDNFNASGGTAFTAQRAIDDDWNTQWASLNLADEAKLTIRYNAPIDFNRLRIKTQPTEGSFYVIDVSDDGRFWSRASGRLSGTDWQIREIPVFGSGRFLRIHWFRNGDNSPSLRHWSVFEVQAVPSGRPQRGNDGGWGGGGGGWDGGGRERGGWDGPSSWR